MDNEELEHIANKTDRNRVLSAQSAAPLLYRLVIEAMAHEKQQFRDRLKDAHTELDLILRQFSLGEDIFKALRTLERKLSLLQIAKITTNGGAVYYTSDLDGLSKLPDVKTVEMVEMTDEEYWKIPASPDAAKYFSQI